LTAKQITRAVPPADLADLLARRDTASLAWNAGGAPEAATVPFAFRDGRYNVKPPSGLGEGTEVAMLIDEGWYNAELRGVHVRGTLGTMDEDGWAVMAPSRVNAWDYGEMRTRDG
jgi:hypothetical protein